MELTGGSNVEKEAKRSSAAALERQRRSTITSRENMASGRCSTSQIGAAAPSENQEAPQRSLQGAAAPVEQDDLGIFTALQGKLHAAAALDAQVGGPKPSFEA